MANELAEMLSRDKADLAHEVLRLNKLVARKDVSFSKAPKDVWGFPESKGYGPKATVENLQERIENIEAGNLAAIRKLEDENYALRMDKIRLAADLAWANGTLEATKIKLYAALGEIERLAAV